MDIDELKTVINPTEWLWLGDRLGLNRREANKLTKELGRIFGESVWIETGNCQLVLGRDYQGGLYVVADVKNISAAPIVAVINKEASAQETEDLLQRSGKILRL
jgi:uncharacterized secreted protein with C-terminal beta-propeller domain